MTRKNIPSVSVHYACNGSSKKSNELGDWQGTDPATGFHLVKRVDGTIIKIADLVDDDASKRDKVSAALKLPEAKHNRDHVYIIIALGMAKEGFDWIWCEHALTVGYRASLTEIIQIIGRATRDAEGKTHARFTNLIASNQSPYAFILIIGTVPLNCNSEINLNKNAVAALASGFKLYSSFSFSRKKYP